MLQTNENFSNESINEVQKLIENKNIIRDRRDQKTFMYLLRSLNGQD